MGLLLLFDVCASVSLLVMSKVSFLQSPPTQNVLHSCTCRLLNLGPRSSSLLGHGKSSEDLKRLKED